MKLGRRFKPVLFWTSALLYITGAAAWALNAFFQVDQGYGFEPSPLRPWALHSHSILGLISLVLFGYLWGAHIEPGLKHKRKKRSGLTLISVLAILFLTTPLLFYLTDETARRWAAMIHTWAGIALLAPFLYHLRSKKT
jgi:hypothetical protein